MSKADDIVRARLTAEAQAEAQQRETAAADALGTLKRRLTSSIPRLVARLQALDYPDAELVSVASYSKTLFRTREHSEQKAGWILFEERDDDGTRSVYVLADGRFVIFGGGGAMSRRSSPAVSVDDFITEYNERAVR